MPDRVADDAVDASPARDLPGTIKMHHCVKRELAGRRGLIDSGVGKRATRPQRKNASRQAYFTHGNRHDVAASPSQAADSNAVRDGTAMARKFRDFSSGAKKPPSDARKIARGLAEIVLRHHQACRSESGLQICRRNVLRGLYFDIAPAAACPHRSRQNIKLSFSAAL